MTSLLTLFSGFCEDLVQESLVKLLTARYVERCPASEPVLAARVKEETTAKKRGPKSARVIAVSCQVCLQTTLFYTIRNETWWLAFACDVHIERAKHIDLHPIINIIYVVSSSINLFSLWKIHCLFLIIGLSFEYYHILTEVMVILKLKTIR